MKLTGNIHNIKTKRDSRNAGIEIQVNRIEYITYKKDGKYYQAFDFEDELETPLVITGDCLARDTSKHTEEGEIAFKVYDKTEENYTLNEQKSLTVDLEVDYDEGLTILTYVNYTVVVSNEEFQQIKSSRAQAKRGKSRKR